MINAKEANAISDVSTSIDITRESLFLAISLQGIIISVTSAYK